jgi:hypothetical protein
MLQLKASLFNAYQIFSYVVLDGGSLTTPTAPK